MSIRRRLEDLERREPGKAGPPRSPENVYNRIRREAQESIEESLNEGSEPLYEIAANGDILTWDGRTVNHYGDFIQALDRHIAKLDKEIEEEPDEERRS